MFLPVLLVRDFGLWGWIVFAIPNVLGAAWVGAWSYRQPDGSSLLARHEPAMRWFSLVTIAFHVFFVAWLVPRLLGGWALLTFVVAVLFFAGLIKAGKAAMGGWLALIFSGLAALVFFAKMGAPQSPVALIPASQAIDLACLAPAIVLGFVLCPHLDLTLQASRQSMPPGDARITFAAGFMGLFLLLIAFTLVYAGALQVTLQTGRDLLLPTAVATAIGLHMCIQGGFTTAAHAAQVIKRVKPRRLATAMGLFVLMMVVLMLVGRSIVPGTTLLGYDPGEVFYRLFMSFYGLVFPAYAWSAWVWRKQPRMTPIAWLAPMLLALPGFAAGFLAQQPVWIIPAVLAILILPYVMLPASSHAGASRS